jgi:hypothetical protein
MIPNTCVYRKPYPQLFWLCGGDSLFLRKNNSLAVVHEELSAQLV